MAPRTVTFRVRYQETDAMGVVYYANYFVWFEIARTEFLRSIGHSYREIESHGHYLMVVDAECTYKSPARYDDAIVVETQISYVKNCSMAFTYTVYRDTLLLATGKTSHVLVNKKGAPVRIPEQLRHSLRSLVSAV